MLDRFFTPPPPPSPPFHQPESSLFDRTKVSKDRSTFERREGLIRHPSRGRCYRVFCPRSPDQSPVIFHVVVFVFLSTDADRRGSVPARLIKYSFSYGRPNPRPPRWDEGETRSRIRRQINQKRSGQRAPSSWKEETPVDGVISGRDRVFFPLLILEKNGMEGEEVRVLHYVSSNLGYFRLCSLGKCVVIFVALCFFRNLLLLFREKSSLFIVLNLFA